MDSIILSDFFIATYLITVNMEMGFIVFNTPWLSNNFLLTFFGGAFASMLVMMLCELQKYRSLKTSTEDYLFYHGMYLYQMLRQMHQTIEDYLFNSEYDIPQNLLDNFMAMIQNEMRALQCTDYATFNHKYDSLMAEHGKFRNETLNKLQPILQGSVRLQLAINESQKENIEYQIKTKDYSSKLKINSCLPRVKKVMINEKNKVEMACNLVDSS